MSVPSRKSVKRSRNEINSASPLKKLPRASTSHARSKSALPALSAARSNANTTPADAAEEAKCGELAPLSNSSEERSDAVRSACGRPMRSCRKQQVNYNDDALHPDIDDEEKEDNAEEKGELKQRVRMTGQSSEEDDYNDEEESDYCDEQESDEDCVEQLAPVASSPCASSLSSAASVASVVASSYTLPTAYTHYTVTATAVGGHKRGFTYFDVNTQILPRDAIRLPLHTALLLALTLSSLPTAWRTVDCASRPATCTLRFRTKRAAWPNTFAVLHTASRLRRRKDGKAATPRKRRRRLNGSTDRKGASMWRVQATAEAAAVAIGRPVLPHLRRVACG